MRKSYSVKEFMAISEQLLSKHYGLTLNDTRLCEEDYVNVLVSNNTQPFEYLNEIAEDFRLIRIDVMGLIPLSKKDQDKVIAKIRALADESSPSP